MSREKLTRGKSHQKSHASGHVTKLFLELEFQHLICLKKINRSKMTVFKKNKAATDSENEVFKYYPGKDKNIFE